MDKPEVIRMSFFSVQVCVPEEFTDEQVKAFADGDHPAGTQNGWIVRKGDPKFPDRAPCNERKGCIHIVLDC